MGAYYYYVNRTKKEIFSIGALGGGIKFGSIGMGLTARAFDLMILKPVPEIFPHEYRICGRWHGDRVAVECDDSNPDWDEVSAYLPIDADVAVMLYEFDGFELLADLAAEDNVFFVQLCYLVVTNQYPRFEAELSKAFGPDFLSRYGEVSAKVWTQPKNLALGER